MAPRSLVPLVLVGLLLTGCATPGRTPTPSGPSGSATPSPLDRIPVSNSVLRDGVRLTIQLDAGQVTGGDEIRLIVEATNTEPGIVMWQGGGCDLLGNIVLEGPPIETVPIGDPPQTNDAAGITGLIRWAALSDRGSGHTMFVPPNMPAGANFGCPSDLRINELKPGETERVEAIWHGTTTDGIPAPAGAYRVTVSFPYLERMAVGPFEGDPFADAKPIVVEVPYQVVGSAWQGISAAAALDRALADARVQGWIAGGLQRTEIGGATIRLTDGAIWRFEVTVMDATTGQAAGTTVVDIDPASGAVTRVELPDA
jgi:hypothetical protein